MAAAATATASQIFQNRHSDNNDNSNNEVSRQEIQAAIAKAVELRALHAALMQGNSPANLRYSSSASPVSHPVSQLSAQDYPVFTPSYEDEALSESWDEYGLEAGNGTETVLSDYKKEISASRKGFSPALSALESHICPAEDEKSVTGSCANHITVLQTSPETEFYKSCRSRRNIMGDFKSVSSCNRYKPAVITTESENVKNYNTVVPVPLTDSHSSVHSQPKSRGVISWLFPRLKKKQKNENSPNQTESEEVSQVFKDFGMLSIETLKRERIEANENRDAALMEVLR
ncbi:hypothetical protein CRYUN_Cryun25bG0051500 [Craigia yunnanensis]